jgi:hypothetical protein
MVKIKFFLLLIALTLVTTAQSQIGKKIVGNNKYVTLNHEVGAYKKVTVSHVKCNVVYKNIPDSVGYVRILGEENIVHLLDVSVNKEELTIKKINMVNIENGLLMIYVYSPAIENIDLTGAVIFESYDAMKKDAMKLAISGSGQIKLHKLDCKELKASLLAGTGDLLIKGTTENAHFSVVGSGEIRADNLLVNNTAYCKLIGNGNIGCNVSKLLKATITGVGCIYYKGKPEVKSTIIGTGNVKPLDR